MYQKSQSKHESAEYYSNYQVIMKVGIFLHGSITKEIKCKFVAYRKTTLYSKQTEL